MPDELKPIEVTFGPGGDVTINHPFDNYPLVFRAGLGPYIDPNAITPEQVETVVDYLKLFNAFTINQTFNEIYLEAWVAEAVFEESQEEIKENSHG